METEMTDRLFLELSQFTKAKTANELRLEKKLADIRKFVLNESDEWESRNADRFYQSNRILNKIDEL